MKELGCRGKKRQFSRVWNEKQSKTKQNTKKPQHSYFTDYFSSYFLEILDTENVVQFKYNLFFFLSLVLSAFPLNAVFPFEWRKQLHFSLYRKSCVLCYYFSERRYLKRLHFPRLPPPRPAPPLPPSPPLPAAALGCWRVPCFEYLCCWVSETTFANVLSVWTPWFVEGKRDKCWALTRRSGPEEYCGIYIRAFLFVC